MPMLSIGRFLRVGGVKCITLVFATTSTLTKVYRVPNATEDDDASSDYMLSHRPWPLLLPMAGD